MPGQGLGGRGVTALAGQVAQCQDGFIHQAGAVGLQLIWTHRATAQGAAAKRPDLSLLTGVLLAPPVSWLPDLTLFTF